ncbi:MAG: metalloregulator ArsR/SmtB family transcription factor [Clostridia bacterium]
MEHKGYVKVFKALSDETRLRIVDMLSCGEMCACTILEDFCITQPTLSYHMGILTASGLVTARKDGSWMKYSINAEMKDALIHFLSRVTNEKNECICREK